MSLQFIMGPSGAGKSHYLYQWITTESQKHPEKRYIVLVPEQFTMQAQKDLVAANPRGGILNVEVHSFHRLAHRIFEETGERGRMILTDIGKNFVIRKIAGEREKDLRILGANLKKMGYVSELQSIISEFTQYDIKPCDLAEMIEKQEQNPALFYKLQDIRTIYEGFQQYLQGKYITGEEILDVLADNVQKSKLLEGSVIVLDGFTGFTPIQNKLLKSLLNVCEKLMVTVTIDAKGKPYQLFELSKQMVTKLAELAKECKVETEAAVCLYQKPAYRFRESEALDFLETNLFRYSKEQYEKEQENIQIWCAKNPKEEMDYVAQAIRRLVRTKGYRYRDIAVIANDMQAYANDIEKSFAKYDVPVFMDYKRSILSNACVEYIRSLISVAEQDFSYESVFRYLRTGFTDLEREEVDILENYVIALGIRGYKKWQEKWIRRTKGMEESELAKVNDIRERFVINVADIMEVLKGKRKTVLEITCALHEFFLKDGLQKKVKEYQLIFEQAGELALEKEYAQVYRIIIDLLDQLVELLGDEYVSMKEYCELLDAGLEAAKVGVIPPSLDQVVVGDLERSRMKDIKVLFLIGANDCYIPGPANGNGLLSEYDRKQLTEKGMSLAPNATEKNFIQRFYLYLILTKPSNQVCLTYSKTAADGNLLHPSYLITDLLKLYKALRVREVTQDLREKEFTVASGIDSLVEGLQRKKAGLSKEWQELYNWYKKHPEWSKKIEQLVEATFYRREETSITRETAKKLYGEVLENSVTRLEKFSACAYAHFLSYGLALREREEYQFRAVDMGTLFHAAIEKFSKKLQQSGYTWTNVPENEREVFLQDSVEESIVDYGNSILYSTARNEYMIARLKRMLRRSVWALTKQLEKGDFVPENYEISLSVEDVELAGGERMRLRGKIDRIDVCEEEDNLYVKVIDYKTGEKAFDLGELCYGLQMQLVIYMNAAVEMQKKQRPGKQVIPAGLFYYRMKDPIIEKPGKDMDAQEIILKELRPDGILQGSDSVVEHLDRGLSGTSQVIPAGRTQNGKLSKASKTLTEEEFQIILDFAKQQVKNTGSRIMNGEIRVAPYEMAGHTGCEYCPYQSVCGFEEKLPGYEYRKLEKLGNEDALEKMRGEVETWE